MNTLGNALIISGPVAMLAAAIIYRFHLSRIIAHLKTNYHSIWSDLAGGNYSANPLILKRRLIPALKNGVLDGLRDPELNSRIRMYKFGQHGIWLGLLVTLLGVVFSIAN